MKYRLITYILIFILTLAIASAQVSVTENQVTITANKETYFCEPIFSPEGCLIQGSIDVTNSRPGAISSLLSLDSNKVSYLWLNHCN